MNSRHVFEIIDPYPPNGARNDGGNITEQPDNVVATRRVEIETGKKGRQYLVGEQVHTETTHIGKMRSDSFTKTLEGRHRLRHKATGRLLEIVAINHSFDKCAPIILQLKERLERS